jgi:hypothetical protein
MLYYHRLEYHITIASNIMPIPPLLYSLVEDRLAFASFSFVSRRAAGCSMSYSKLRAAGLRVRAGRFGPRCRSAARGKQNKKKPNPFETRFSYEFDALTHFQTHSCCDRQNPIAFQDKH